MSIPPTSAAAHDYGSERSESHAPTSPTQLPRPKTLPELRATLTSSLKQYPDFPKPGILFEDIFPLFSSPDTHRDLISAFILTATTNLPPQTTPDVILGLDARGFLIGPQLALHFNCAFLSVPHPGKLPGALETAEYVKEYGKDVFAIQKESVKPGAKVLVVDDLIATGGSAAAAGELVKKCGGALLGYIFLIELTKLGGREKLDAPVWTILESQAA